MDVLGQCCVICVLALLQTKASVGLKPQLILSDRTNIYILDTATNNLSTIATGYSWIMFLDFHEEDKTIFWSDESGKTISRVAFPVVSTPEVILRGKAPRGVAVDEINDQLYWADRGVNKLFRSDLNGTNTVTILEDLDFPNDVQIDQRNSWVYVINLHRNIQRCRFDGSESQIVVEGIEYGHVIRFDFIESRIYWSEYLLKTIYSVQLSDGSDKRKEIDASSYMSRTFGMELVGNYIYFSEYHKGEIYRKSRKNCSAENEHEQVYLMNTGRISYIKLWDYYATLVEGNGITCQELTTTDQSSSETATLSTTPQQPTTEQQQTTTDVKTSETLTLRTNQRQPSTDQQQTTSEETTSETTTLSTTPQQPSTDQQQTIFEDTILQKTTLSTTQQQTITEQQQTTTEVTTSGIATQSTTLQTTTTKQQVKTTGYINIHKPQLILSDRTNIYILDTATNNLTTIATGYSWIMFLDFHEEDKTIFWSDESGKTISRVAFPVVSTPEVILHGKAPRGVAVDEINDQLYWADRGVNKLFRSDLNGTNTVTILEDLDFPNDVQIDQQNSWVYVINLHRNIQRCRFDGSESQIVVEGIEYGHVIRFDFMESRIYWSEYLLKTIYSVQLSDGSDKRIEIDASSYMSRTFGMELIGNYIYFSEYHKGEIYRKSRNNCSAENEHEQVYLMNTGRISYIKLWDSYAALVEGDGITCQELPTTDQSSSETATLRSTPQQPTTEQQQTTTDVKTSETLTLRTNQQQPSTDQQQTTSEETTSEIKTLGTTPQQPSTDQQQTIFEETTSETTTLSTTPQQPSTDQQQTIFEDTTLQTTTLSTTQQQTTTEQQQTTTEVTTSEIATQSTTLQTTTTKQQVKTTGNIISQLTSPRQQLTTEDKSTFRTTTRQTIILDITTSDEVTASFKQTTKQHSTSADKTTQSLQQTTIEQLITTDEMTTQGNVSQQTTEEQHSILDSLRSYIGPLVIGSCVALVGLILLVLLIVIRCKRSTKRSQDSDRSGMFTSDSYSIYHEKKSKAFMVPRRTEHRQDYDQTRRSNGRLISMELQSDYIMYDQSRRFKPLKLSTDFESFSDYSQSRRYNPSSFTNRGYRHDDKTFFNYYTQ